MNATEDFLSSWGKPPAVSASFVGPGATIAPSLLQIDLAVANAAARLALTTAQVQGPSGGNPGDIVEDQDTGRRYEFTGTDPSNAGDWTFRADAGLLAAAAEQARALAAEALKANLTGANFTGPVTAPDAVNPTDVVTLQQLNAATDPSWATFTEQPAAEAIAPGPGTFTFDLSALTPRPLIGQIEFWGDSERMTLLNGMLTAESIDSGTGIATCTTAAGINPTASVTVRLVAAKGQKGDPGVGGVPEIHYITGAPSNSIGVDGDTAIDLAAKTVYGPKAGGAWPGGVAFGGGTSILGYPVDKVFFGNPILLAGSPSTSEFDAFVNAIETIFGTVGSIQWSGARTLTTLKRIIAYSGTPLAPAPSAAASLTLAALEEVRGSIIFNGAVWNSIIAFPALKKHVAQPFAGGGSIHGVANFNNCALPQATVDALLAAWAALDGTNGTTLWAGSFSIAGGTTSTPSAAGLASKAIIVARGGTVINN